MRPLSASAILPRDFTSAFSRRDDLDWAHYCYVNQVTSTSDVAIELAESGFEDGTFVLAGSQTGGRGRRGRGWYSPPGVGIYCSILFRGRQSPLITLMSGVAVAEAIRQEIGLEVELKWPNDVVLRSSCESNSESVNYRKVAGILTERLPATAGNGVVVGIGVNVGRAVYPSNLVVEATSLEEATGQRLSVADLLASVLAKLWEWKGTLAAGKTALVIDRLRNLCPRSEGSRVSWRVIDDWHHGVTVGIDEDGALMVDCGGRIERIIGGEVKWM